MRVDPFRLLVSVVLAAPIGTAVGAMVNADVGVGPIDVSAIGISEQLGVAVGTAALLQAVVLAVIATVGGVPPGPSTFLGVPVFAVALNWSVGVMPEPESLLAYGQFGAGLLVAALGVSGVVALDVGVGPPEALMLAIETRSRFSLGPIRVVLDLGFIAFGLALGASVGIGTVVTAVGFGPLVAWMLPIARRATVPIRRRHRRPDPGQPPRQPDPTGSPTV